MVAAYGASVVMSVDVCQQVATVSIVGDLLMRSISSTHYLEVT